MKPKELLGNSVTTYRKSLPGSPAESYLDQRGLAGIDGVDKFCLGYVADPIPDHVKHTGKLAIPYLRHHPRHGWMCVSMRFRALDGGKPKYASLPGDKPRLFNTEALNAPSSVVGICEGEIDAITMTVNGLPTVGIPGANMWQDYWPGLFRGYETVFVFTDGDDAGHEFGRRVSHELSNARVIPLPDGEDINSIWVKERNLDHLWKM